MATIKPLLAKILIQVGADEPKEIGTIEIPINVSIPERSASGSALRFQTAPDVDAEKVAADVRSRLVYYMGT